MEKARLKLIVRNMKLLVDSLESEIYSDPEAYTNQPDYAKIGLTYREDNDDDGYTDWMKDRKAAKQIIKRSKKNPQHYSEQEVQYAKLFRRATKKNAKSEIDNSDSQSGGDDGLRGQGEQPEQPRQPKCSWITKVLHKTRALVRIWTGTHDGGDWNHQRIGSTDTKA